MAAADLLPVIRVPRGTVTPYVITVGANLDTDAWTQHHGYLPLTGSLNPAASTAKHPWPEAHLYGGRDTIVPASTTFATEVCAWSPGRAAGVDPTAPRHKIKESTPSRYTAAAVPNPSLVHSDHDNSDHHNRLCSIGSIGQLAAVV